MTEQQRGRSHTGSQGQRAANGSEPGATCAPQTAPADRGELARPRQFDAPLTIAEVARVLGASRDTVYRLVVRGRIAHERPSRRRLVIRESALRAYLESIRVEGQP
jgi:excisionase family DNA binding protein